MLSGFTICKSLGGIFSQSTLRSSHTFSLINVSFINSMLKGIDAGKTIDIGKDSKVGRVINVDKRMEQTSYHICRTKPSSAPSGHRFRLLFTQPQSSLPSLHEPVMFWFISELVDPRHRHHWQNDTPARRDRTAIDFIRTGATCEEGLWR